MAQESVLRIIIDSRNAERNARNVARELQNIERNGDHASRSMDSMSVATRSLVGYMGGLVTIGAAISKMDAYTGLQNRLKLVTDSQVELNTAMNDTFGIAQKTASSWDSVAMVYQRFADNADRLNITMAQTSALTETVSKAISVSGGSAASAEAALMQFGQALASGVLRGEEFNSIAEQAPGLLKAIAFGLNTNVGSLRAMAQDGKITGDVLVDALGKAKPYIDDLFNRTDFTISQSFTKLSNEVTKFVGEAGKGSGAASALSDSIGFLAKNLSTIADIAIVGGVAMLTKTILAQTVAIQGSITASVARRAADIAVLQSQVQLAALEVQRTRQISAQAISEIGLARQELNSATTRTARAAATMRLTQAEIAHRIALNQTTAAIATNTAAQNALNASRAIGTRMLALVGGPIGAITIGVTALAAGYMLLSDNSEKSTKSLRDNNEAVGDAIVKYRELNGIQRDAQMAAERQKLDDLNEAYRKASAELMMYASNMSSLGEVVTESQVELSKLFAEYKKTGDLNAFNTAVQNSSKVSQDAKDKTANFAKAVFEAGAASKTQKEFIAQLSGELNGTANAGNSAAAGVRNLASALTEINTKLSADVFSAKLQNAFEKQGKSAQSASRWTEVYNENAKKGFKGVTIEQKKMLDQLDAVDKQRDARQKAAQASASALTKASKAALTQQKKEAKELERDTRQALEDAKSLIYDYTSEFTRIETDLKNEIEKINNSSLKSGSKTKMIADARTISEARKKLYAAELDFELNEYSMSESEKLKAQTSVKKLRIDSTKGLLVEERKLKKDSADKESAHELGLIQLTKEQRIFQMQQGLMSANAQSERYWELERIRITRSVQDLEERNQQLAIANALQAEEKRTNLNTAVQQWGGINAEMTGTTDQFNLEKERFDRLDASQALFDAELAMAGENYALKEQAYQAYVDRMIAIENAYQVSSVQLQLGYGEQMASSMSTMMGAIFGEKSKAYAAAFAVEKAFAVAQAALAMGQNIAQASKMGFPYNIPMIAGAMAQGAQIASIISSVAQPTGMAHNGIDNIPKEGTWLLDGGERVLNPQQNKDLTNYLADQRDTYRVGMGTVDAINRGADVQAEKQAQANAKVGGGASPNVNLNPNFVIVDERESMSDYLFSPDGTKAFVKFFKRNRSALGV